MVEKTESLLPLLRKNFLVQWGVMGMAFLAIAGIMISHYYEEYHTIQRREGDRLLTLIRVIDGNLNRQLGTVYQVLTGILDILPQEEDAPERQASLPDHFKQLRRAIPGVQTLVITDASGNITISDRDELIGQTIQPHRFLEYVMVQTDPAMLYVSYPFQTDTGNYAIDAMLRLPSSDGSFTGVVSATLAPDFFTILPASELYAPDMWTAIAHGDGIQLIMLPYREGMAGMNLAQPGSFFSRHRDSGRPENLMTGTVYATGEERIMALHTIRPAHVPMDKPLVAAAGRNSADIHTQWRSEIINEGTIFILVSVSISIGLIFFQRRDWVLNIHMAEVSTSLKISEDRYRSILQTAMDGFFVMNMDGSLQESNESYCTMSGYEAHEIRSLNLADLEAVIKPNKITSCLHEVVGLGKNRFESRHRRKDGTIFDVEVSVQYSPADGGLIISFIRDITDRKKSEEALRASEEKFSIAFRTAPYAVSITRADNGKFVEINDTFAFTTGYECEELLNATSISLRLWVDESARDHVVGELQNGKKIVGEEHRFRKKNGDIIIGIFSAAMIFLDNERCILSSIGDITEIRRVEAEREKLQEQFNQAQKMESVGRLAGGVAHDFNNMLSIIHGYTGMAMDEMDPNSPIYADLEEVRKAADRSANLTRQLLAFARKQTAAPIVLDVNETVEGMIKMLKRLIGENIELFWKPGKAVWPVKIDPSQIDQILANLCVNARDAIDGVGKLTISTKNVVFDAADCTDRAAFDPGEYALLIVEDTGCGMGKETLSNIFEPFYTTKPVDKGTGLGLATVYGIIRQNNGFVNVYSEPGIGSIFRIYLPRYHFETDPIPYLDTKESATSGHETILLVEDDRSVLRMTAKMLERLGYTVLTADTPGNAIQLAKEYAEQISLLMTDVIMPGMNGLELSREIMSIYPKLKLLFVSGYTTDIIARHGVLEKGVHFIEKPLSKKVLADKLREVFDRHDG